MEGRFIARGRTAVIARTTGLVLLIAGSIDASILQLTTVDLGVVGAAVAGLSLAGLPLYLLGRRRHPGPLPGSGPAPVGDPERSETPGHRDALLRLHHRRRVQAVVNAGDGMVVVFQPIVDLRDGSVVGHESLARFADGRPPNEWFDEAHAVGMGVELEMAAIAHAITDFGDTSGYLSINLSPSTLTSSVFLEFLVERADATKIVIELTEHAVVEDYEAIRSALGAMRDVGARIAVDDAGSGISSMRHILTLAPDIIKLDRSLVAEIDTDRAKRALALSLAQFATGIKAELVAEGIERAAEMTTCYESGVRYAQGHLLGRPGPLSHTTRHSRGAPS